MDMVGRYQSTNKAWESLLSAVRSLLKWLHMGITWPKDTNSEAFARRTVTASDSICSADGVSLRFLIMLFKLKSRREALKISAIALGNWKLLHKKETPFR